MKHLRLILITLLVLTLFPISSIQARAEEQARTRDQQNIETMEFDQEVPLEEVGIEKRIQGTGTQDRRVEESVLLEVENDEVLGQKKQGFIQEVDGEKVKKGISHEPSEQAVARRSKVANSVQEMLQVAERNEGVGTQIREIARVQNQIQEEADTALNQAQERKGFVKFLVGSDNSNLNIAEEKLTKHQEKIEELEVVKDGLENETDREILTQQIEVMKQVSSEIEKEITDERQGFSLFGWFSKLFSKRN